MSLSVGASSNPLSYLQTLMQQDTASTSSLDDASDPIAAFLQSVTGGGSGSSTSATQTSDSVSNSSSTAFDTSTMTALLSTQDQSQSGDTPQSILFNQVGGGQDIVRQTNGRDLPGAVAASGTDTSAGGTSGPAGAVQSATDASGATVQTETNADGSITTVTTYADGSTSTSTTAALTDGDGTSDTGSGKSANAKLAAQWTQLQSQLLSAATSTLSLLV